MSETDDLQFYVIELSDPPYTSPDKYVCVPDSWIRLHDTADNSAVVKFPIENLSETKKRVERGEEFSKDWMIFWADVKYAANSYSDAKDYIEALEIASVTKQNKVDNVPEVSDKPSTSGMGSMLKSMTLDTNDVHLLHSNGTKPANIQKISKKVHFTNPEVELHKAKSKEGEANFISNPKKYWVRRSLTELSPPITVNPINQKSPEDSEEIMSDDGSCDEDIREVQQNEENDQIPLEQWDKLICHLRTLSDENVKGGLKSLCSEWENLLIMFDKMRIILCNNIAKIKKIINYTEQLNKIIDLTVTDEQMENSTKEKKKPNLNNVLKNKVIRLHHQNKDQRKAKQSKDAKRISNESEDEEDQSPQQEIRESMPKFTLPPEYDPDNSRWTLRNRKQRKGLVELVPHSGVYVNAIKLNYFKIVAKNSQTLARMLLMEIFTQNALSTCTITGRQSHIFDPQGTNGRPGLDKRAMTVLLKYVFQYTNDKHWFYSEGSVIRSIRCKLNQIRAKYA